MAKFAIYQYLLGTVSPEDDPNFKHLEFQGGVDEIHPPASNEEKQEIFGKIFKGAPLVFKESLSQVKPYPYKLIPCEANDNIIIIRIAANKKKNFEQNFADVSEDWNPSTLIIIDNRRDIQRIAIQVKQNAFSTKHLADILQKVFADRLREDHMTIEISPKMYSGDFWRVTDRHKGRIQNVQFDFTKQYLEDIKRLFTAEIPEGPITKLLEGLEAYASSMNVNPSLITKAAEQSVEINKDDAQLKELVKISAATGQPIKILTLDGISYDCYLLGDREPTEEEKKRDRIVVQELSDNVVSHLTRPDEDAPTGLFDREHKQEDITNVINFMNNLKFSYD